MFMAGLSNISFTAETRVRFR